MKKGQSHEIFKLKLFTKLLLQAPLVVPYRTNLNLLKFSRSYSNSKMITGQYVLFKKGVKITGESVLNLNDSTKNLPNSELSHKYCTPLCNRTWRRSLVKNLILKISWNCSFKGCPFNPYPLLLKILRKISTSMVLPKYCLPWDCGWKNKFSPSSSIWSPQYVAFQEIVGGRINSHLLLLSGPLHMWPSMRLWVEE